MNEDAEQKLREFAESNDRSFAEVEELWEEERSDIEGRFVDDVSEDEIDRRAVDYVFQSENVGRNTGETTELAILAIGNSGTRPFGDGTAVMGYGVVSPPDGDKPGITTFIHNSDEAGQEIIDLAQERFKPLNTLRGTYRRRSADDLRKGGKPVYTCNATTETEVEEVDPDSAPSDDVISQLPANRDGKRELLNQNFIGPRDAMAVDTVPEHISKTNGDGFSVAFGADIKRLEGTVMDVYVDEEGDWGRMTVGDPKLSVEDLPDEMVTDGQRYPGVNVWLDPRLCDYGEKSVLDVYGTVSLTDDGEVQMNGYGAVPIIEYERDPEPEEI